MNIRDLFRRMMGRWTSTEELVFWLLEGIRDVGLAPTMDNLAANPGFGRAGAERERRHLQAARIRCSQCGKALEYLGGAVAGPGESIGAMEQWRGNVCVPCRKVLCPDCIAVGAPTPCPKCAKPTHPAMEEYVNEAKSLNCWKCGKPLAYMGFFGAAYKKVRSIEGTGETDAGWEEWSGHVCVGCRKVICNHCNSMGRYTCPDCGGGQRRRGGCIWSRPG